MLDEKVMSEVLSFATDMLNWKLPMVMTEEKLTKIKAVATSAITQTHNYLHEYNQPLNTIVIKPNISINDLVKLNRRTKTTK